MTKPTTGENLKNAAAKAGVGAALGGAGVACAFRIAGLTFGGPVSGGWFAANMGPGLVRGEPMSRLQSAAMTPGAYLVGAGILAVAGGVYALYNGAAKQHPQELTETVELTDGEPTIEEKSEKHENADEDPNNDPVAL